MPGWTDARPGVAQRAEEETHFRPHHTHHPGRPGNIGPGAARRCRSGRFSPAAMAKQKSCRLDAGARARGASAAADARSPATRRAYAGQWARFTRWCELQGPWRGARGLLANRQQRVQRRSRSYPQAGSADVPKPDTAPPGRGGGGQPEEWRSEVSERWSKMGSLGRSRSALPMAQKEETQPADTTTCAREDRRP